MVFLIFGFCFVVVFWFLVFGNVSLGMWEVVGGKFGRFVFLFYFCCVILDWFFMLMVYLVKNYRVGCGVRVVGERRDDLGVKC